MSQGSDTAPLECHRTLLITPAPPPPPSLCSGPGTYELSGVCTNCTDTYYRSGDATPENNVCKPIPAGYREKTVADALGTLLHAEIMLCELGTFSAWTATSTREPATPTTCTVCTLNAYAPRKGMQRCIACKAGTIPSTSTGNGALGPDMCTACGDYKFRPAFVALATCANCSAGSESGPSNHAACTPW